MKRGLRISGVRAYDPCSRGNFRCIANDRLISPNIAQYRAISRNIAQYRAILLHAQPRAGLVCATVPRPSRFVPKLVDSAKTTESKMALKFAHLMSPLPHGANRHS